APVPAPTGLSPVPGQGPPTDPVHRLAGGCYSLQVAGGPHAGASVRRSGPGYTVGPGAPAAFRTEAAQLGRFLFYGGDGTMLTGTAGDGDPVAQALHTVDGAVAALPDATPGADWRVDYTDGTYGLTSTDSGRRLAVDGATAAVVPGPPGGPATRLHL